MNFPLKNIERHLDEQSLLRGEELLSDQQVHSLTELEKHLWIAKVRDDRNYEVEAKISPSRVLAGTCECERYRDIGMCEHLAALLFLLRRRQTEKKLEQKQKKKAQKTHRKLTTGIVLDSVSHEELTAFVRQYAKTNRSFALALKARFAPQVELDETREKYTQLLDSALSMARKMDGGISLRGSRKIYKVLVEMQGQIEDAIIRQYYADAFHIIQSIIEKITPILKKLENNRREIQEQIDHSLNALQEIVVRQPPPALQAEIWEYSLGEAGKLRFRNNDLDTRLFRILFGLADEARKKEQLSHALTESLYKYEYEGRNPAPILLLQLQVLEVLDRPEQVQQLLDHYLTEPDILRYAIRQAMQKKDHTRAKMLARSGRQKPLPPAIEAELEDTLLHIAESEGDRPTVIELAINRLTQSLDITYARRLRKTAGSQWTDLRRQAIERLRQQPFSRKRDILIGQLLADDECWEALLEHLESVRSLELLQQFDRPLVTNHREEVYRLYRRILADYIQSHLGRKPSTRIRQTLLHLHELKADDLVRELVEQFRNNYPERHTLMEELSLF